ncbi:MULTISPECIES: DUF4440 domain-containing protein [Xanthomonas]|uniref:DUF4440 domain-containing protein n=1 Tax=Xanthomonas cucurbitae TaxID=56453 RepID=A0A2S7DWH7_9XANT|nr:DUF4440 domain-containing protein [Xanthomonas cucurbitae]PPU78176.1 DUF4440 domain-containing protein [Xanthomonas cucurbitae]QHG86501.1 DUF4440 domain-containing protein [Xanthomonas cucurbitae]WDM68762.1 DUF4440 domain-containing protein [Xanthomonas cucurbitae]WDM72634.1 DUF4440 domain-containing protein [Xanthomonas cucurbitae]WDM76420.1 DUF4440 domain-containing protein [Xanthomonas cucurbitae]
MTANAILADHRPVPAVRTAAYCLAAADKMLLHWTETVGRRDIEAVLALYAPDAILVPTLSDDIRGRDADRRAYFASFLAADGLSCGVTVQKKRVSAKLGTVVIGGLYTFVFERDGVSEPVHARFLFTFEEIDGQWLITGHHSSRCSEGV